MMMKQGLFDVPNLDDITLDVAEMQEVSRVLEALAVYARARAEALHHRLVGNTSLAVSLEQALDRRYYALSEGYRW